MSSLQAAIPLDLLIVDDDPSIRNLLSQVFRLKGHKVRCAEDGFSALERMRESLPDVLLSDLNMPGMSGFELLSVVRRRLPEIYVIATSGAFRGDDVPRGIAADAFHEKATPVHLLVEQIDAAGRRPQSLLRGSSSSVPHWVALGEDRSAQNPYVMLGCWDCLRSFAQPVEATSYLSHEISVAECSFCRVPIHYAVVQPLNPTTSQPYAA